MVYLRSGLFSLVLWVCLVVFCAGILVVVVLPYRRRYPWLMLFPRFHNWLLKTVCGLTFEVQGKEHIPQGAAVILAKHQSTWETFAMATIFPPYVYVLKRELMWLPFFGWAVALLHPIAIDRGAGRAAVEQIVTQGRERLESGMSVFLFPEGTRMPAGTRGRYRIGGAVLAAQTGYPVVPVAHNAGTFWPRRGFVKRAGTIRVVIGAPITTRGKSPEQVISEAETWIEGTMQRLDTAD